MKIIIINNKGTIPSDKDLFKLANKQETPIKAITTIKDGKIIKFSNNLDAFKFAKSESASELGQNTKVIYSQELLSEYTIRIKRTSSAWFGYEDEEIKEDIKNRYDGELYERERWREKRSRSPS